MTALQYYTVYKALEGATQELKAMGVALKVPPNPACVEDIELAKKALSASLDEDKAYNKAAQQFKRAFESRKV